jgi:hypothetical protein
MHQDPELIAMSEVHDSLKSLDQGQVKRVLAWISSRLNVELEEPKLEPEEPVVTPVAATAQIVPVVQLAHPVVAPVTAAIEPAVNMAPVIETVKEDTEEEDITEPEKDIPSQESEKPKKMSTKGLGLKRYKNIENLFLAADIKSVGSRILLAAAYLQEKHEYDEMSSYDINSRLKKLGYGVSNITTAINTLLNKKTPLMMQTKKDGTSKQAKRKFKVTEEGLELAKSFLKSAVE